MSVKLIVIVETVELFSSNVETTIFGKFTKVSRLGINFMFWNVFKVNSFELFDDHDVRESVNE